MKWISRKSGLLVGLVIGMALGLVIGPVVARPNGEDEGDWTREFLLPLQWAVHQIQIHYVEQVHPRDALVGAYRGILNELDKYSSYIPRDRLEEFQGDTKGQFGGLGIQIRYLKAEHILRVEHPIPGTPAFRQGVLAGDIILKVREESTGKEYDTSEFENVHDAVRILRGEPGTEVTITIVREGTREEAIVTIKREIIKIPGVRGVEMINEERGIAYVYVPGFHQRTAEDLSRALKELKEGGMQALVLDLRFNPGGLLESAVELSDLFLEDAVVVSTRGRASAEEIRRTEEGDALDGAPLAVLVNGHSASASEIIAGAIKDNGRGLVVGQTTYGKGSVQTIIVLRGGEGAFKLTTARYYTPSGVCIHEEGIAPDVTVELTDQETRRLARKLAETKEYPPHPQDSGPPEGEPQKEGSQGETGPPNPQEPPGNENEAEGEDQEPFRDVQLDRAVDILIGMLIQQQRQARPEPATAGAETD